MAVTLTQGAKKVRAEPYIDAIYNLYIPSDPYERLIVGKVLDKGNTGYSVNDVILFDALDAKRIVLGRTPSIEGSSQYIVHEDNIILKFTG
jgi:hypothetical protein